MRQKYRTTCFADALVDYPGSLEDDPKWKEDVVGFRLVHDEVGRVYRGGTWIFTSDLAGEENRYWSFSTVQSPMLGLRLVADWRTE